MNQAIAGVSSASSDEVTVMTVWPSIAKYGLARVLGQAYSIESGFYIFTIGNLIALASIPIALVLYAQRAGPFSGVRYRLTNRRITVQRGITGGKIEKSLNLDRFDSIDIVVQPGQAWYDAGDLVFRQGTTETFRLDGVSRPESFRQACLKSRLAYVGVREAVQQEAMAGLSPNYSRSENSSP